MPFNDQPSPAAGVTNTVLHPSSGRGNTGQLSGQSAPAATGDWWSQDPVVTPAPVPDPDAWWKSAPVIRAGDASNWADGITLLPHAAQQQADPGDWASQISLLPSAPIKAAPFGRDLSAPSGDPLGDLENMSAPGDMSAPIGPRVRAMINAGANGVMLGFAPRIAAAFDYADGSAPSYTSALAGRNADQDAARVNLGGGYDVANLAGSALLPFGLLGDAARGATLGGKILLGGGTGAALGGVQGAASSPDLTNIGQTATDVGKGAAAGAAFGAGLPVAGSLTGAAVRAAAPFFMDRPEGMGRAAFGLLANAVRPGAIDNLDRLGPDAMLADASPSFTGLAQGAAGRDSEARGALTDALMARNAGTNGRLQVEREANLGPAFSGPEIEQAMQTRQAATGPMYAAALGNAGPIDTTAVRQGLEGDITYAPNRSTTQQKLNAFADYLRGPGNTPSGMPLPESDAGVLHGAKVQMSDDINAMERQEGSAASMAARQMTSNRNALGDALAEQVPGYADANLAWGTAERGLQNFNAGTSALDGGKTAIWPRDLDQTFGALPLEQQALYRAGARSDIERAIDTTPNDLVGSKRMMGGEGDFNRSKMSTLFGDQPTQNVLDSIDREQAFRDTHNLVVNGSRTAPMTASIKSVDNALDPQGGIQQSANLKAMALGLGQKAVRSGFRALAGTTSDAQRLQLAQALTATGSDQDAILPALSNAMTTLGSAGSGTRQALSSPAALGAALALHGQPRADRPAIR